MPQSPNFKAESIQGMGPFLYADHSDKETIFARRLTLYGSIRPLAWTTPGHHWLVHCVSPKFTW
ncbi:MAG: hypothetical protein ACI8PT_003509, partial [Gammaproteobacteria bacterium]